MVDWSHPLAVGLKSLVFPADLVDLVRGTGVITVNGTPTNVGTPYGAGRNFNGTTDYLEIGTPIATAGAWSLFAVFRATATATGAGVIAERYPPANTNVAYALGVGITSATPLQLECGYYNSAGSGAWQLATGSVITIGRWNNVVATYAGNAGAINLYLNGLRDATGSGSGADPTPDQPTRIAIRHDATGSPNLPGDIAVTGIWNRALSANEVATLYADPFCILRY